MLPPMVLVLLLDVALLDDELLAVFATASLLISEATLRALSTPREIPAMAASRLAPGVTVMAYPCRVIWYIVSVHLAA